jgi:ankyrin repeat protein
MLGQNTSDDDCVTIIKLLEGIGVNNCADNVVLSGTSQIDPVSDVTPLHLAVLYKGLPVVNELLRLGGNPDQRDNKGNTPLMYSCKSGYVEKAAVFIQNGADPSFVNGAGESTFSMTSSDEIRRLITSRLNLKLHRAIRNSAETEEIERLLSAKADVNSGDADRNTALTLAIRNANYPLILKFLEIDGLEMSKGHPLHDIISSSLSKAQKEELIHELLFCRVDPSSQDSENRTALDLCLISHQSSLGRILKESGATGSRKDPDQGGETPSSPSSAPMYDDQVSPRVSEEEHLFKPTITPAVNIGEIAMRIGDLFAELDGSRRSVDNLELISSARGSPSVASTNPVPVPIITEADLVALKIELLNKLNMYLTEFERAKTVRNKDFKAIGNFIELQKMIALTRSEITRVNERISSRDFSIPDCAADQTASSGSWTNRNGGWFRSPESIETDIDSCMRQIRKSSGSLVNLSSAMLQVVKRCQSSCVIPVLKLLRNRGSDVNFVDMESGMTSLMVACKAGSEDLVDWLISSNPSIDVAVPETRSGRTALHLAAQSGSKKICELLVKKGKLALLCATDKNGKTARDVCGNPAIARVLSCEPAQSS